MHACVREEDVKEFQMTRRTSSDSRCAQLSVRPRDVRCAKHMTQKPDRNTKKKRLTTQKQRDQREGCVLTYNINMRFLSGVDSQLSAVRSVVHGLIDHACMDLMLMKTDPLRSMAKLRRRVVLVAL